MWNPIKSDHAKPKLKALDTLGANVMIADADLKIVYMNPAVSSLLQGAEADLKKELPRFSVANLIGSNIDIFHKNPSHQRKMLAGLNRRHSATIWLGGRAFDLLVSPLMSGDKRAGFVVEWGDAKARLQNLDFSSQIEAIGRSQMVIEFNIDGTVITANDNFLIVMGYKLDDVKGQHHRIFAEPAYRGSREYTEFWEALARGKYQAAEFKRRAKDGRIVTIQGSYNPILDATTGKVVKVVKFATDVTRRVEAVSEIGDALTALAIGDLEQRIEQVFPPELDKLRVDFNQALETLQGTMQLIGRSSNAIETGTGEISTSAGNLSQRTEQQAASLEETAATLDHITATVKKTAEGANEARGVVATAKADAEQSSEIVREAVRAMDQIEHSSRQIGNIIGVIDEIAFQTNLLALNAGVEAARAGDAGKGFAVVASEVRALAQRSAEAAKEIKALISASTEQVSHGVERVGETGKALVRIVNQVSQINSVINDIAAAAQNQATGLQEINTAVNQMDRVTQQNAAMVQETANSAQSLRDETEKLSELIAKFRFGGGPAAAQTARRAHPVHAAQRRLATFAGGVAGA